MSQSSDVKNRGARRPPSPPLFFPASKTRACRLLHILKRVLFFSVLRSLRAVCTYNRKPSSLLAFLFLLSFYGPPLRSSVCMQQQLFWSVAAASSILDPRRRFRSRPFSPPHSSEAAATAICMSTLSAAAAAAAAAAALSFSLSVIRFFLLPLPSLWLDPL